MIEFRNICRHNRTDVTITAVFVGLAIAVHALFVVPGNRRNRKTRVALRVLDSRIESSSMAVNNMTRLIGTDSTGSDLYDRVDGNILPDLLDAIAQQGRLHGVEIVSMRPSRLERTVLPAQGPLKHDAESTRLVVHVTARSRYRDLGEYLIALERIDILVAVRNLKIYRVSGHSPVVRASFEIETWVVKTKDA